MKSIGQIIKEYRLKCGMTQEKLGAELFVSKQAVSKWERDITLPDLELIRRLCDILAIPSSEILQKAVSDPRICKECEQKLEKNKPEFKKNTRIEEWRDYKFGMFIHYGVYSVIGRINEWVMFNEPIDRDDYADIARKNFVADKFDAAYYASLAKRVGMKYMVMTTRHHDGFSLFDSKHSWRDFTVMHTPAKRDLIREYTDACRAEGLGVGLYYSPMDWRFEGYFFPLMYLRSAEAMRDQCYAQVRELMENYGKIDVLWFDGGDDDYFAHGINLNVWSPSRKKEDINYAKKPPLPEFWREYEMHKMVRSLQPHIVVNNRFGGKRLGDYTTPERKVGEYDPEHPWETCDSLYETWGWVRGKEIMSLERIVHLLVDVVTGGGNLLFNVSPRGDGSLDPTHEKRLLEVGEWVKKYADCIYGTRCGPFKNSKENGGFNRKGNRIYAFIYNDANRELCLPLLETKVETVSFRSGESGRWSVNDGKLCIDLGEKRALFVSVIEIELDRDVAAIYGENSDISVF